MQLDGEMGQADLSLSIHSFANLFRDFQASLSRSPVLESCSLFRLNRRRTIYGEMLGSVRRRLSGS